MIGSRLALGGAALLVVLPASLSAQTASEVLTVREALVDALVSDHRGNPVADLTARDFVLKVDGRRVPVQSAAYYDCLSPSVGRPALETVTSPRPESRFFVLMSDISAEAARRIAPQLREWTQSLQPWDYLAVGRFVDAQISHQGFSRDRIAAAQALAVWETNASGSSPVSRDALVALRGFAAFASHIQRRKNVILLTDGWSGSAPAPDIEATITALNSSGVAVYAVRVEPGRFGNAQNRLVRGTSGDAWKEPDVVRALDNVLLANRGYYLVGFTLPALQHNYQRFSLGVRQAGYRISALPRQRPPR